MVPIAVWSTVLNTADGELSVCMYQLYNGSDMPSLVTPQFVKLHSISWESRLAVSVISWDHNILTHCDAANRTVNSHHIATVKRSLRTGTV